MFWGHLGRSAEPERDDYMPVPMGRGSLSIKVDGPHALTVRSVRIQPGLDASGRLGFRPEPTGGPHPSRGRPGPFATL